MTPSKTKSVKSSAKRLRKHDRRGRVTKIGIKPLDIASRFSLDEKERLLSKLRSILDGGRPVMAAVRKSLVRTVQTLSSNGNVGSATISDDVMSIRSAPHEIPAVALSGYQFLERRCRISKLATQGTAAGGFFATLLPTDFASYTTGFFRIKRITSWTAPVNSGTESQFAGFNTPGVSGSEGTEALPSWTEDFTRIGNGYAGIEVSYPMGDFLLYGESALTVIASHYTSLGGTGGVTGVPVVFDVLAEVLV